LDIDKLIVDFKSKVTLPQANIELFDKIDNLFKGPMWRD
jgi:hypothetical protein